MTWNDVTGDKRSVRLANWSERADTESTWDGMSKKLRGQFTLRFEAMRDLGTVPKNWLDHVANTNGLIWEWRAKDQADQGQHWRGYTFQIQEQRTWFITHFFPTEHGGQRYYNKHRDKALRAYAEHLQCPGNSSLNQPPTSPNGSSSSTENG